MIIEKWKELEFRQLYEFSIQNNKREAKCHICLKNIITNRKVKIRNKKYHLGCYLSWVNSQINVLSISIKNRRKQRQKILRFKDNIALEEIAK